jgi:hypothetical protein
MSYAACSGRGTGVASRQPLTRKEGPQMRLSLTLATLAMAALLLASPAFAITGGRPDNGDHPYVALMQTYDANRVPLQVCSGSLISPTVFLTAGHCVAEPRAVHAEIWLDSGPILPDVNYLLALFLDPNFTGSCNHTPAFKGYPCDGDSGGTPHAHPDFCFDCRPGLANEVSRDVAVVTLDRPVAKATVGRFAELPAPRQVETLANRSMIDLTGYGVQYQQQGVPGKYFSAPPPGSRWAGSGQRMRSAAELVAGSFAGADERIRFTLNANQGTGGICFGDSGGPDLVGGTDTVLAVNSFVTNHNCSGVGYSERVDVPEVLAWIRGFMP